MPLATPSPKAAALALLLSAAGAGGPQAADAEARPPGGAAPMMVVDRATFVPLVASANAFEIQSSRLALDRSGDADIKKAARMIVADHTRAGEMLKTTLEGKGVALPEATLAPKHRTMIDQLKAANGAAFDTLYLDMQTQAHLEAIALFRTYAGSADDQALAGFAKHTLPSLETHLAHVKRLAAKE